MDSRHERVVRDAYAAFSRGEVDELDRYLAPGFVDHELEGDLPGGVHGVRIWLLVLRAAFPDLMFTVEDVLEKGDRAAVRVSLSGTHEGEFMGCPPTGRCFAVDQMDMFRFEGGRIAEHWGVTDAAGIIAQLGIDPPLSDLVPAPAVSLAAAHW